MSDINLKCELVNAGDDYSGADGQRLSHLLLEERKLKLSAEAIGPP
jgi:hypothetical protein